MTKCPECENELEDKDRFCGQCGAAAASASASGGDGLTRIEVDPLMLNTLLNLYASKPGGPQVRLEDGHVKVTLGDNSVDLSPVRLNQAAQVAVSAGTLGRLNLSVDTVNLGERGLEIQLRLK